MRVRTAAWIKAFASVCFVNAAFAAPAPDYYEELGLNPYRQAQSDVDVHQFVDPFSGLLHRRYVDLRIPGNGGLDIEVVRAYNNVQSQNFTHFRNPVGIGWTIHFGRVLINTDYHICSKGQNVTTADNPVLEHPDGRKELLYIADAAGPYSSFLYVTSTRWKAVCAPSGNGLVVTSPTGVEYTMDFAFTNGIPAYYTRLIRDKNGNQITVSYKPGSSSVSSTLIDKVSASDGRLVEFFYANETTNAYRLTSIRSNGQTWQYEHTLIPEFAAPTYHLTTVRRPDNSTWTYTYFNGSAGAARYSMSGATTPFGGTTQYTYAYAVFGNNIQTTVLASRNVLQTNTTPAANWTYTYVPGSSYDTTTINGPGVKEEYRHFGYLASGADSLGITRTVWKIGLLLEKSIFNSSSVLFEKQTYSWGQQLISLENQARNGRGQGTDTESYAPVLTQKIVTRDGTNYTAAFSNFDAHGNAQTVIETGTAGTRRTDYVYLNNTTRWLLRAIKQQTIQGIGTISRGFDLNGNMTSESRFGVTTSYTYTSQGDISSVTDARGNVESYSAYKRGIATSESRPEAVSISRVVNNTGTIASETNGRGNTTTFSYDGLNRLTAITLPIGSSITISRNAGARTRTVTQGLFRELINYDNFGRPFMVDRNGVGLATRYDEHGRVRYKSYPCYPSGGTSCPNGRTWTFDPLGRVVREQTPSGITNFTYQTGGNVRIVTPRGTVHTNEYDSYGDPVDKFLTKIITPELTTTIARNAIGLITGVTQGSYTRSFSYDSRMYLVSVTDPETGSTAFGRDAVGNLTSRTVNSSASTASTTMTYDGLSRLKTVSYSNTSSFEPTSTITYEYDKNDNITRSYNADVNAVYTYDAVNNLKTQSLQVTGGPSFGVTYTHNSLHHLTSVTYPSGRIVSLSPDVLGRPTQVSPYVTSVSYHANGAPASFTSGNSVTTTLSLTSEQLPDVLQVRRPNGVYAVNLNHNYDASGNLTSITDLADSTYSASFAYDGTDRLSGANGFWGSGSINYDAAGNIANFNLGSLTRTYSYTTQNRLSQVSGSAGTWSFSHDPHGNVTADGRFKYRFNVANQLASVSSLGDVSVRGYGYDPNGLRFKETRNGVTKYFVHSPEGLLLGEYTANGTWAKEYAYLGSKLVALAQNVPESPGNLTVPTQDTDGTFPISWSVVTGASSYELYEATSVDFDGQQQVFSGASTSTTLTGRGTGTYYYRVRACSAGGCSDYRVGGNSLQVILPPSAPGALTLPTNDSDGAYAVSWGNATGQVTSYEVQESLSADFSSGIPVNVGMQTSYDVTGRGDGTYYYRVRACNSASCGPYRSGDHGVVVLLPPGTPPSIAVPGSDADGNYSISWGTSSGTVSTYELYESASSTFASQALVYSGTALSAAIAGKAEGTYYYRVRACNTSGCSGYRVGTGGLQVVYPPLDPASISIPGDDTDGQYTISWGASFGQVDRYELYESVSQLFTMQTLVYSGSAFSHPISGRTDGSYYYRVRACNISGCSGYRAGDNPVRVLLPPGTPAAIVAPTIDADGSYSISWTAGAGQIQHYDLYESTSAAFADEQRVYTGTATTHAVASRAEGTYYYRVLACNGSGCSPSRAADHSTRVVYPPEAPPSIVVPSIDPDGGYLVSWGNSVRANYYELVESANSDFAGAPVVFSGSATTYTASGRAEGLYYYRVRACNDGGCSGYIAGANPARVLFLPETPSSLTVPSQDSDGSFTIAWGQAAGTVDSYELYETRINPSADEALIYSGPERSASLTGRNNGDYAYSVRACNQAGCGSSRASANSLQVRLPPTVPSAISVPVYDADGSYRISWGSSSGQLTAYQLEESTSSSFSTASLVYSGTALFTDVAERAQDRAYYYRVRACNDFSCGTYRTGTNPVEVYRAPDSPRNVTAPAAGTSAGYSIEWLPPTSGTVTHYEVEECGGTDTNQQTCTTAYSGADTSVELRGRSTGVYQYAVAACNRDKCSAKVAASNATVVAASPLASGMPATDMTNPPNPYVVSAGFGGELQWPAQMSDDSQRIGVN